MLALEFDFLYFFLENFIVLLPLPLVIEASDQRLVTVHALADLIRLFHQPLLDVCNVLPVLTPRPLHLLPKDCLLGRPDAASRAKEGSGVPSALILIVPL